MKKLIKIGLVCALGLVSIGSLKAEVTIKTTESAYMYSENYDCGKVSEDLLRRLRGMLYSKDVIYYGGYQTHSGMGIGMMGTETRKFYGTYDDEMQTHIMVFALTSSLNECQIAKEEIRSGFIHQKYNIKR